MLHFDGVLYDSYSSEHHFLSSPEFLLTNPAGAYREYESVTLRFDRRYADGWSLNASAVWADLTGNTYQANGYAGEWDDINGQTNADGNLANYADLEIKVRATADLPWGILGSIYYRHLAGEYWTPTATFRGLFNNDRESIFLTERGSEQYPNRNTIDFKLSKKINLNGRLNLHLSADIFNLLDEDTILDVDERWGDYRFDFRNHPDGSEWRANSGFGEVLSREFGREIRLGLKASF